MSEWSKTPPSDLPHDRQSWWWWRDDGEPEPVRVERSNHKPPWWQWWRPCCGSCGCYDETMVGDLDLNYDATGPVEDGYEPINPIDGEWWTTPIRTPPTRRTDDSQ